MTTLKKYLDKILLALIMASTGFLTFFAVGNEGYSNQYYSAAVKSMLTSWHNFFFASFDAGGFVTVDKPAFGLWLQAISAFIFGFHGWSLILPEALSAVVSVAVLYHLVKRYFGVSAGLISALILGFTPILIAVARTNNLDSSLVLVLLLSAWALIKAAEKGSLKLLLVSVALIGLGFNIKMLQAFMAVPAIYLTYFLTAPLNLMKRLKQLAAATALLIVVSLSWAAIVDLTPADSRPYIGSSSTNSVIELALGYNGIQRLTGDRTTGSQDNMQVPGGNTQSPPVINMPQTSPGNPQVPADNSSDTNTGSSSRTNSNWSNKSGILDKAGSQRNSTGSSQQSSQGTGAGNSSNDGITNGYINPNSNIPGRSYAGSINGGFPGGFNGGPGGVGENGMKSIFRLFNRNLSGQIGWFLPMALFGLLILALEANRKENDNRKNIIRHLVFWSSWIVPMMIFFSFAGFFHRYYLSMLAPGIAALSGIAVVELWKAYNGADWKWALLPAAIVSTAAVQYLILSRYNGWTWLAAIACGISLAAAAVLIVYRFAKKDNFRIFTGYSVVSAVTVLLIAPAIWSYTPVLYGSQATLPYAGPDLSAKNDFGSSFRGSAPEIYKPGPAGKPNRFNAGGNAIEGRTLVPMERNAVSDQLIKYLQSNKKNEKYLVAVQDANTAAPIILQTGEAVMAIGGFSGSDKILTTDEFIKLVEGGQLRYFLMSGRGMLQQSGIANWVQTNGKAVNIDGVSGIGSGTLYDLSQFKG